MIKFIKNNYHSLAYLVFYTSIIIAFFLDLDVTSGPKKDLSYTLLQVKIFEENFLYSFLNYDKIEYPNRLSPIYISILTLTKKIFINIEFARFFLLHILILTQIFFYKCLKIVFYEKEFDKKIIFFLSCIIFLSPNFRANIIWVESSMFGLLFFSISLYYFLKNTKKFSEKNVYLNILFLAIASYLRPSYCLFSIYFFFEYITTYKRNISLIRIILLNLILALPALYYVFILEIFFIKFGGLSTNYFNKIAIVTSIIFFHSIPFIFIKKVEKINYTLLVISVIVTSICIIFFDYNLSLAGGGIFLHLSNFLFDNNYLFYFLLPIFLYFLFYVILLDYKSNLLLIVIFLLLTPQYHIFHKYYDPIVFTVFLTLINFDIKKELYLKKGFILSSYFLFTFHYLISFINSYFLKF
tara:strand:- start:167 stop:1399 length:1233 start_codon:yes stop_codon:yes gene_type:complete